jgi:hypothetical protein
VSIGWKPVPKVLAAGLGGAVATLLVWLLAEFAGRDMPPEAGAALAAVLAFAFGYLKSPAEDRTSDAGRTALGVIGLVLAVVGALMLLLALLKVAAISVYLAIVVLVIGVVLLLVDGSSGRYRL